MKKIVLVITLLVILLAACTNPKENEVPPTEIIAPITIEATNAFPDETLTPPSYLPLSSDGNLTKAKAMIDSADLIFVDASPVQVNLILGGYLPTPCHELRIHIPPPDDENNIKVEVYSVADPEVICEQVLRAFSTTVYLGNYPSGSYWVWVNEERIGNFDF